MSLNLYGGWLKLYLTYLYNLNIFYIFTIWKKLIMMDMCLED